VSYNARDCHCTVQIYGLGCHDHKAKSLLLDRKENFNSKLDFTVVIRASLAIPNTQLGKWKKKILWALGFGLLGLLSCLLPTQC